MVLRTATKVENVLQPLAVPSAGVVVEAEDAAALAFYKKYGFIELPRIERRLSLPMGTVERLFP